ncbi:MAG: glycosyltransferase family 9 protein [Deltaproteobacteria bacterium]|nr:glycosyltransferase family 9 protein [Deltaproteobacteria bacterium]
MAQRILLTQLRRIGDVLMTTAATEAVRQAYPQARICYLTERPSDIIFRYGSLVNEVIIYPRGLTARLRTVARLRSMKFDLAVDFFSNPRSAMIVRATGATRRIGFDFPGRRYAYTDRVALPPGRTYAARHKAMLLQPLGLTVPQPRPLVRLGEPEREYARRQLDELGVRPGQLLVAFSPVSRQPYKVWPAKNFARLADILIERYDAVVLPLWGPGEEKFIDDMRLAMHHAALPDYPIPDLLQMAALMEKAHLFIGNDNGPRHFAMAVGTPTVAVFGRPRPESWTPPDDPAHRALAHDPGCKDNCTYPRCRHLACINEVPYQAVEAETENLLEEILKDGRPH